MVDVVLFEKLLRGIKDNTRLVIVGDVDQLPSVGAGNVLRDLINSKKIKYTKLVDIFRQSESSNIIVNAHKINNGQEPILNEKNSDFFFLKTETPAITRNVVTTRCAKLSKEYTASSTATRTDCASRSAFTNTKWAANRKRQQNKLV